MQFLPEKYARVTIATMSLLSFVGLEQLITISEELALAKGQTTQEGLMSLAECLKPQSHSRAIKVFERINSKESLRQGAMILMEDALSLELSDCNRTRLFKKAIKLLKSCGSPRNYQLIGDIYMDYFFEAEDRYKKAFEAYNGVLLPLALLGQAEIVRYGYHGERPNPETARETLLSLKEELERNLNSSESKVVLPRLYNDLGSLFEGSEDLDSAKQFYRKSNSERAVKSLAALFHREGNNEAALKLYETLQSIDARIMHDYIRFLQREISEEDYFDVLKRMLGEKKSIGNLGSILVKMTAIGRTDNPFYQNGLKEFTRYSHSIPESERLFILSELSFFNNDDDQARIYLSNLVLGKSPRAIELLAKLEDRLKKKELMEMESLEEDVMIKEESESDHSPFLSQDTLPLDKSPNGETLLLKVRGDDEIDLSDDEEAAETVLISDTTSTLTSSLVPKLTSAQKKVLRQERAAQKILDEREKSKRVIGKKAKEGILQLVSSDAEQPQRDVTYTFSGGSDVEKAFNDLRQNNTKFRELLVDISENLWKTKGSGQPEVLKYVEGYMSRRLNQEDRLVYKVIGPRKIDILRVEGHYKK